jgi:hypothetical protein
MSLGAYQGRAGYVIALAIGILVCAGTMPIDFILARSPFWTEPRFDVAQHISGLKYYLGEPWTFPVFDVRALRAPGGTNIIYTDSIPILAFFTKIFANLTGVSINPLGGWFALCWILQPVAAVFALRSTGTRSILAEASVATIVLFLPAWLARYDHLALCSHFLLLIAIGFYFRAPAWSAMRWTVAWSLLFGLTLLIHPYLLFMVLAIGGASWLRRPLSQWLPVLVLPAASLVFLMFVSGHFAHVSGSSGFGFYSMNALSPFWPQRSGLLLEMNTLVDATGGQYEGFNYLGAGILLLAGAALALGGPGMIAAFRVHWPLVFVAAGLTLLALSDRIFFGPYLLADLSFLGLDDWLEQIRSSGRVFWPVAYIILIAAAATIAVLPRPILSAGLLMAALGLQILDGSVLRAAFHTGITTPNRLPIDVRAWEALMAKHRAVLIYPEFTCATGKLSESVPLLVFAASNNTTPINTAYLARMPTVDCTAGVPEVPEDVLFVTDDPAATTAFPREQCIPLDGLIACGRYLAEPSGPSPAPSP